VPIITDELYGAPNTKVLLGGGEQDTNPTASASRPAMRSTSAGASMGTSSHPHALHQLESLHPAPRVDRLRRRSSTLHGTARTSPRCPSRRSTAAAQLRAEQQTDGRRAQRHLGLPAASPGTSRGWVIR
jgi:hypothetical protein